MKTYLEGRTEGSLTRFTNKKNSESRVSDFPNHKNKQVSFSFFSLTHARGGRGGEAPLPCTGKGEETVEFQTGVFKVPMKRKCFPHNMKIHNQNLSFVR